MNTLSGGRKRSHSNPAWRVARVAAVATTIGVTIGWTAAKADAGYHWSQSDIQRIIRTTFPNDSARALCIADYESDGTPHHWDPAGRNGSMTGLFQIDQYTWDPDYNSRARPIVGNIDWDRMMEPAYNAMVAKRIYNYCARMGYNPWFSWATRSICGG
jgi:hypothetical protein